MSIKFSTISEIITTPMKTRHTSKLARNQSDRTKPVAPAIEISDDELDTLCVGASSTKSLREGLIKSVATTTSILIESDTSPVGQEVKLTKKTLKKAKKINLGKGKVDRKPALATISTAAIVLGRGGA